MQKIIEYQLQMKSQALRTGHRTPQPCQWLGWIVDSLFLAAYKHKFISIFGESLLSPAWPSLLSGDLVISAAQAT